MVSRQDKAKMSRFICDRLEDSSRYNILEREHSHIFVAQRPDLVENPRRIYVVLHNQKVPVRDYQELLRRNREAGILTGNLFFKDDRTYMVRLAERGHLKGDERSLKHYTKEQRDDMIHLRALENEVLQIQEPNSTLVFYQPETHRLDESIRGYVMEPVELDYSHVTPDHPSYGFVWDTVSKDYRLPSERYQVTDGPVVFESANPPKRIVSICPMTKPER